MMRWLSLADCKAIYIQEVAQGPLLRQDMLESALAAPLASFSGQDFYPTLVDKVARLAYGIAESQAYQDGNKRLAWHCAVVVLANNGIDLRVDQDEAAHIIRAVGDSSRPEGLKELTAWLAACVFAANWAE